MRFACLQRFIADLKAHLIFSATAAGAVLAGRGAHVRYVLGGKEKLWLEEQN
jgi:hypothetical protein